MINMGSTVLADILALHQHNYTYADLRSPMLVWQEPPEYRSEETVFNPRTGMPFYHGGVQDNAHVGVRVPP